MSITLKAWIKKIVDNGIEVPVDMIVAIGQCLLLMIQESDALPSLSLDTISIGPWDKNHRLSVTLSDANKNVNEDAKQEYSHRFQVAQILDDIIKTGPIISNGMHILSAWIVQIRDPTTSLAQCLTLQTPAIVAGSLKIEKNPNKRKSPPPVVETPEPKSKRPCTRKKRLTESERLIQENLKNPRLAPFTTVVHRPLI